MDPQEEREYRRGDSSMTLPRKLLSAALLLAATVTHAAQSRFSPAGVPSP